MQDVLFVVSKILRPMFTSPLFLCLLAYIINLFLTSAWHMRRSAAIFSKAGFRFEPLSVDSLITPLQIPKDFFPDAWALERSTRILIEIIGYIAYRILGRL